MVFCQMTKVISFSITWLVGGGGGGAVSFVGNQEY